MTFIESIRTCMSEKYFSIEGRASRSEFWWFYLAMTLGTIVCVSVLTALVTAMTISNEHTMVYVMIILLFALALLALVVPSITASVRRLHDTGRSGWWYLINFVPYIGGIVLIVFLALPSDPNENEYGAPEEQQPTVL